MVTRRKPRSTVRTPAQKRAPPRKLNEAIDRLMGLLAACGYNRSDIQAAVTQSLRATRFATRKTHALDAEFVSDAPHVLTLWFKDPTLLGPNGKPKPLPLRGRHPSVEMLVQRLERAHDPKTLVDYLRRIGGIRSTQQGWIPTNRYLLFASDPLGSAVHALEGTLGYLRTTHRNVHRRRNQSTWFEARLTSRPVPKAKLKQVDHLVRQLGHGYLATLDRRLGALENRQASPNDTVRVGIGSYYYEMPE